MYTDPKIGQFRSRVFNNLARGLIGRVSCLPDHRLFGSPAQPVATAGARKKFPALDGAVHRLKIFCAFPFRACHFKGGGRDWSPACGGCRIKWQFERRGYLRRQLYVMKILSRKHFASSSEWAVHYSPRMKDHASVAVQQSRCVVADAVSRFTMFVLDWYATKRPTSCSRAHWILHAIAAVQYGLGISKVKNVSVTNGYFSSRIAPIASRRFLCTLPIVSTGTKWLRSG